MYVEGRTRRLVATALAALGLVLSIVGCGSAVANHNSSIPQYRVTAILTSERSGGVRACYFLAYTQPPQCGVGIHVSGVDLGSLRGVQRYSNGTVVSGPVELTGNWDQGVLAVSTTASAQGTPTAAHFKSMTPLGTGDPMDAQRRLNADANVLANRGIVVLENGFKDNNFYVVVAVADDATVAYLTQHYGPVVVGQWLVPT